MKKLCIYHGNCADGFGAATAVRIALGADNVDFHAGRHGQLPPDVTGRSVIIVDFSYKREVLIQIAGQAESILILDHHKSAHIDFGDLSNRVDNITAIFDMDRSGAVMAWQHFLPERPVPQLLLHIQDRDLWKFELDGTREVQACVFSHPFEFPLWESLLLDIDPQTLREEGRAIERKHAKDLRELIASAASRTVIAGYDVPVLNAPFMFSSDAGNILGAGEPFAACYSDSPKGRAYSLRSAADGVDVSLIASKFGGGGHKHAAGFMLPIDQLGNLATPMDVILPPHQVQAVNERLELKLKIAALETFFITELFSQLPINEQNLIQRQHTTMIEYCQILELRIAIFD